VAFNGSGTFNRIYNWVTDKSNTVPVTASRMDAEMDGMATGLSTAICRDGQSTATARIPFAAGVGMSDGSVGTPAINFTGDTNSGVYLIGADNVGVAAGGAKVLDVGTAGLGVTGTLTASGAATLSSTAAVTGNFAVNTDKFTVAAASGNTVVAGTLDVDGTLDVAGAQTGTALTLTGDLVNTGSYSFGNDGSGILTDTLLVGGAFTCNSSISAASVTGSMVAAQADMETGTSTTTVVTPGRQQYHPSAAKVWASVTTSGGTPTLAASHNVSSITDGGVGIITINLTTAFSSATYGSVASHDGHTAGGNVTIASVTNKGTTSFQVRTFTGAVSGANVPTSASDENFSVAAYGDQ
jgi:hypothetical protein